MRKITTLMFLFVALSMYNQETFAQEQTPSHELNQTVATKTEELSATLNLNLEQKTLVQKAFTMYETAIKRIKANNGNASDYKNQVAKLRKNLNTVLSDKQYKIFEEILTKNNLFITVPKG